MSDRWKTRVTTNLRRSREERGIVFRDLDEAEDLGHNLAYKLESGVAKNIYFDVVYRLCRFYDVDPRLLLAGDDDVVKSHWPQDVPSLEAWDQLIRTGLRDRRKALGLGTPTLGKTSNVRRSWIAKIELGKYRRLDMIRIHRLAVHMNLSMRVLLAY